MSENQGAVGAPTLEEAIKEIEGLKEQLSGSDLKVFTQNRELRQENQKLRDEITRLTEECVTQTFAVRSLEKGKTKLEARGVELESKIAGLETQVADLQSRIEELTEEVGVHRSQEIHLSQELERTVSSNAQEVAKLQDTHAQEVAETKRRLEEQKAAIEQELSGKLQTKAEEVESLLTRVEQFKEEFLSQELTSVAVKDASSPPEGKAFGLLRTRMETLLGFPGKTLVEQVFRHCGADEATSDPEILEEAFEALQDTASKLVRNPEQEQDLANLLSSVWSELGLGSAESSPVAASTAPSAAAEPPQEESPEEEPSVDADTANQAPSEESAEAQPSPEAAVSKVDSSEEPVVEDEAGATEEPTSETSNDEVAIEEAATEAEPSDEQPPSDETDAVTEEDRSVPVAAAEEPTQESAEPVETEVASDSVEDATESAPSEAEEESTDTASSEAAASEEAPESEPSSPVEEHVGEEQAPEDAPSQESAAEEAASDAPAAAIVSDSEPTKTPEPPAESESVEAEDATPEASSDDGGFEAAAAALQDGDFAKSWPVFHRLRSQEPTEPTYLVGEIASLAGLEKYEEAYLLGKGLDLELLEDSAEVYRASFETVLIGMVERAETLLKRKKLLCELIAFSADEERIMSYLDEAEEISLRTAGEGQLSLLQARHRVGQDDVTEYLIDALGSLSDRPEIFSLIKENLQRYPELAPLSEFMERLLQSSRAEALEAEVGAKELVSPEEPIEDQLDDVDPGEEALVQVFLEHLLPRTGVTVELPSEEFEDYLQESEPAAFVGALRQALRSVDYTMFFDEIEVISYDGDEHFLLRSSPEPKPTLLFGANVDDAPPEELRFLVLRELFSMYRRHSHLAHLSAQLDDAIRWTFVNTCLDIHKDAEFQIPEELTEKLASLKADAAAEGQDPEFRKSLEAFLGAIYEATESDSFLELSDFLYDGQLHKKWLDPFADGFAAKQTGVVVASFAIARDSMESEDFETLEETGFGWLYEDENLEKYRELRLRLQRLWAMPFRALVSESEE